MSDYGYDPYQDMGEGDLINMYAGMNPALFGSDPAKRLNYYQDLMSSLGFDLIQTAGTSAQPETFTPAINQTGAMYASNPFYASIFQAIEDGADPITAATSARDQLGFNGTDDDFNNQVVTIATNYAADKAKNMQAEAEFNATNGGGWTMPDGSKYKQTPLGGNDIRATANEYDLLGAPNVDELVNAYAAAENKRADAKDATKRGYGVSQAAGLHDGSDGTGWSLGSGTSPSGASDVTDNGSAPSATPGPYNPNGWHPGVQFDSLRDPATQAAMDPGAPGGPSVAERVAGILAGARTPAPAPAPAPRSGGVAGGDFFANRTIQDSIKKRLAEAANTQVRSDANVNAMRRITALAGLLQGGFPK